MKAPAIKFVSTLVVISITGFLLAKLDTSTNWDDTAITVALVGLSSFIAGMVMPAYAWLWALIIAGFIFIFNVLLAGNYGAAAAFVIAFAGAYTGVLIKNNVFTHR